MNFYYKPRRSLVDMSPVDKCYAFTDRALTVPTTKVSDQVKVKFGRCKARKEIRDVLLKSFDCSHHYHRHDICIKKLAKIIIQNQSK